MSQPPPLAPGGAAPDTLLGDLLSYYRAGAGEGRLGVCRQAALTHRARQLLGAGLPPWLPLPEDVAPDLGASRARGASSSGQQRVCHQLVQALEFLELIAANLLLFPWRKEIRSLKVYTGSFAYRLRPVLSERALHVILGRLGYAATSKAEFSLVQAVSEEDIKEMVLSIFLARVACEAPLGAEGGSESPGGGGSGCQLHSEGSLVKAAEGVQAGPGPSEETGAERVVTKHPDPRSCQLPLGLPEAPPAPPEPLGPSAPRRQASTRSDSEEFLTRYSDLALHCTPLLPKDPLRSGAKTKSPRCPAPAPSPSSGAAAMPSGHSCGPPLVPEATPEHDHGGLAAPRQLSLAPAALDVEPAGQLESAASGLGSAPPGACAEMAALCKHCSRLLGPPTPEGRSGGFPGCGAEKNGHSEPPEGPEPAGEGSSPDSGATGLWWAARVPSHVREPPSTHYVPPGGPEGLVPSRRTEEGGRHSD